MIGEVSVGSKRPSIILIFKLKPSCAPSQVGDDLLSIDKIGYWGGQATSIIEYPHKPVVVDL